jgi:hypothetical protein
MQLIVLYLYLTRKFLLHKLKQIAYILAIVPGFNN